MVWLWGFFGTILLFLFIDALATTPLLKRILYLEDWIYWLIPIYYFFVFFFSFGDINLSFKSILHTFFHFIGQIAAFLIFFSFWGVFAIFGGTDYQANTYSLKQEAPSKFTENSKLGGKHRKTNLLIKIKVKISSNFVDFIENINFNSRIEDS